jgi:hypothetical protein
MKIQKRQHPKQEEVHYESGKVRQEDSSAVYDEKGKFRHWCDETDVYESGAVRYGCGYKAGRQKE